MQYLVHPLVILRRAERRTQDLENLTANLSRDSATAVFDLTQNDE